MIYATIRVRGKIGTSREIGDTLKLLRLNKVNHCILTHANETNKGMLQKAKDYITWGEIDKRAVEKLIKTKGRLLGDRPISEEWVKANTSFQGIDQWIGAIVEGKVQYKELPEVKPIFRLHPPRKGWEGIKRSFSEGGALGYRGKEINKLLERMI
jgi:large subunit ribosomal protein L30